MKFWHYNIAGRRLRLRASSRQKPKCVQIGDRAWQIGKAVVMVRADRIELL